MTTATEIRARRAESAPTFQLPEYDSEPLFLVDDDEGVLQSLGRFLTRAGYQVHTFSNGQAALDAIRKEAPKVLVTDKNMAGMDGLELTRHAIEFDPDMRVILMTGVGDEATAQAALRLGVADYLAKPFDMQELARSAHKAFMAYALDEHIEATEFWLRREVKRQTREIRQLTLGAMASLLNALEARSPHFKGHSQAVGECAEGIARALDLPELEVDAVRTAGMLHDIGMIAVPDGVVEKPGELTPGELQAIRAHCDRGAEILEPLSHLGAATTYVYQHHERLDGSGYPERLRGDQISLGGQIVGLAETWTAMIEDRSFRDRMTGAEAMDTLMAASDRWYSARLVRALGGWVDS
ncbi:MAG: HD-GYP domain-containing protein [Candidatus Longimicrobiales bacterium M2_2A_002]